MSSSPPNTYGGNPANIPSELTAKPAWGVWRWTPRDTGKWSKPPYQSRNPAELASTKVSAEWSDYALAREVVDAKGANGVSFNLADSGYGAADLDHCRDLHTGSVDDWAQAILDQASVIGAYIEVTPSGTGLRVIGRATGADTNRKFAVLGGFNGAAVEVFRNTAKPITVSGAKPPHLVVAAELPNIDALLDGIVAFSGCSPGTFGWVKRAPRGKSTSIVSRRWLASKLTPCTNHGDLMPRAVSNNWLVIKAVLPRRLTGRSPSRVPPTLAHPPRQPASAVRLWICGRRQEAPPTTPQERYNSKTVYRCILKPTQNSKEAEKQSSEKLRHHQLHLDRRIPHKHNLPLLFSKTKGRLFSG